MKKFRLKKEAVPFFNEKHSTAIYSYDDWHDLGIDMNALEEVKDVFLTYGIKTSENSSNLCGWNAETGSHFHFTVHFPAIGYMEHDKFSKGRVTRELMDGIQQQINDFFTDFSISKNQ